MFLRKILIALLNIALPVINSVAQQPLAAVERKALPKPDSPAQESTIVPKWETQRKARTYLLGIPAPRGQIVDRSGEPLAQTRVSYNLAIQFPTPLEFSNAQAVAFAQEQTALVSRLFDAGISLNEDDVLIHYKNRGELPYVILQDLLPSQIALIKNQALPNLSLQPIYLRFYPNGHLAGHILGYAGKAGRIPNGPVQNHELLWPAEEGREGLEKTFDDQLSGKVGQLNITYDSNGMKSSERISIPPQPGYNVVTTLDEGIQRICEEVLEEKTQRGAIVVTDPNNGDILGMASWPVFNPNAFIPSISASEFKALQDDPDIPLLPRAFRSAYPPGSTFKVFVGLAALESGNITPQTEFSCPPAYNVGNLTFRNWKKSDAGMLNFAEALEQSCNTWFYQVGIRMGSTPIVEYSRRLGLGERTGIPLEAETAGRIPDNEYMQQTYKRKIWDGDVANMSIGQGDILISPLQMAEAMGTVGNGGKHYQARLVKQVQSLDGRIVTAYNVRARDLIPIGNRHLEAIKEGMVDVVYGGQGTARRARAKGLKVAGKTGTAQWGPKRRERTAAWFGGFAPADTPRYAFAAIYEGRPNDDSVHGGTHAAPLIGETLKRILKLEESRTMKAKPVDAEGTYEEGAPAAAEALEGEDQTVEDGN